MKIKDACAASKLTERAVRLYVAKGLCAPGQKGGYMDFSPQDVRRLQDVACLRRLGFSIEQISRMIEEPGCIGEMIFSRTAEARAAIGREQEALQALSGVRAANMRSLVRQIESADLHYEPKGPDYAHIDRLSAEEKRRIAAESEQEYRQDRLHHRFRRAAFIAAAVVIALAAALLPVMYLSSWFNGQPSYTWSESFGKLLVEERIELPIVSVLDNDGEGTLTMYLMRDEADSSNGDRALLRDIYTVQARLDGQVTDLLPSLSAAGRNLFDRGSKFPEECEPVLVLRATAWDFIRLGLNPFSSLRSFYSSAVNALLIKLCALPPYLQGGSLTIEVPGLEQYIR